MREKPGARRRARELALALLVSADVGELGPAKVFETSADTLAALAEEWELSEAERLRILPEAADYGNRLAEQYFRHAGEVDALIEELSEDWALDRMAALDRNLLRMAITELLYFTDVPVSAVINEAVELAKLYGTPDSGRFVNGMLGALARSRGLTTSATPQPPQ
ncbi:MAG: transcription antitermination factor NusB [Armatimonadetes bacterium]|nr:transcription antitermination factor NusB [Armatimonadota bacterium]